MDVRERLPANKLRTASQPNNHRYLHPDHQERYPHDLCVPSQEKPRKCNCAVGQMVVFPLWPGAGKPAKRVLLRARKDAATPLRLAAGLVLHQDDGSFTPAADTVLRAGKGLDI